MTFEQPALFDPPGRAPKMATRQTLVSRYMRYQLKTHTLCDACVRDIHERGADVAPYPKTVRWKKVAPNGDVTLLCGPHKEAAMRGER